MNPAVWLAGAVLIGVDTSSLSIRVVSAAFSPDGRSLAVLTGDGVVRLRDVATGEERRRVAAVPEKNEVPKRVAYLPAGDVAVLLYRYDGFRSGPGWATQGTILAYLWNAASGKRSPPFEVGHKGLAVCPRGERMACRGGLWEVASGKKVRDVPLPGGLVFEVVFASDGRTVAYQICESLAQDRSLLFVADATTGKKLAQVGRIDDYKLGRFLYAPVLSPDGGLLVYSGVESRSLHLWNVTTQDEIWSVKPNDAERPIGFASDGRRLVTWSQAGRTVRLRDATTGAEVRTIGVGDGITSVVPSADGRAVALLSGNGVEVRMLGD